MSCFGKFGWTKRSSDLQGPIMQATATDAIPGVHPLTNTPTKAWSELESSNKVKAINPMDPNTLRRPGHIRFVCLSDTHNETRSMAHPVPDGDVLIHAGDFTRLGKPQEVQEFNEFLGGLPHPIKIVIAGNHELSFDPGCIAADLYGISSNQPNSTVPAVDPRSLLTNCTYLEGAQIEVHGLKIYGSPWQPEFGGWAFNLKRGSPCLEKWEQIPSDTDILVTHGPPIGHGDLCTNGARAGCVELLRCIQERIKPMYHVFGHIHEGYGVTTNETTTFINASICTERYKSTNAPIVFDVPVPSAKFTDSNPL